MSTLTQDASQINPTLPPPGEWLDRDGRRLDEPPTDETWAPGDDEPLLDCPTEEDARWNAETSPLNQDRFFVEGDDPTAIELRTVSATEYHEPYRPTPEDWADYMTWAEFYDAWNDYLDSARDQ